MLTKCLVSALEAEISYTTFNTCFQFSLAPLQRGWRVCGQLEREFRVWKLHGFGPTAAAAVPAAAAPGLAPDALATPTTTAAPARIAPTAPATPAVTFASTAAAALAIAPAAAQPATHGKAVQVFSRLTALAFSSEANS